VSVKVHPFPSLHGLPNRGEPLQTPAEQTSAVVQTLLSLHAVSFGAETPLVQTAAWQVSPTVQLLLSLHVVLFGAGGPLAQTPFWQASATVQSLLSLHGEPFGFTGLEHVPSAVLQTPVWH
jgi:uncharacterized membrane protein YjdF